MTLLWGQMTLAALVSAPCSWEDSAQGGDDVALAGSEPWER